MNIAILCCCICGQSTNPERFNRFTRQSWHKFLGSLTPTLADTFYTSKQTLYMVGKGVWIFVADHSVPERRQSKCVSKRFACIPAIWGLSTPCFPTGGDMHLHDFSRKPLDSDARPSMQWNLYTTLSHTCIYVSEFGNFYVAFITSSQVIPS